MSALSLLPDSSLKFLSSLSTRANVGIISIKKLQVDELALWRSNMFTNKFITGFSNTREYHSIVHRLQSHPIGVNILWHKTFSISSSIEKSAIHKAIIFNNDNTKRNISIIHIDGNRQWYSTRPLINQIFPYFYFARSCTPLSTLLSHIDSSTDNVIFYFDRIDQMFHHPQFHGIIYDLAHDSVLTKKYQVFISVADERIYNEMITWNNGEKFVQVIKSQ